ncbi:hypothetical protein AKJ09_07069 [Labilithrix luteola]|uniref:Lipoprotein n=1 Tax=Labilithrix luteola TaxID=1391654 RepID=A0A0K1Q3I3_9BACT|nr:hypothetical protein [Labilithrix luteola]AKV00406.1 hypothetical protein AKJ09_07069 [Labilithrix luteola]
MTLRFVRGYALGFVMAMGSLAMGCSDSDGSGSGSDSGSGSGSSSEFAGLFSGPSADATPDSLLGLWGGTIQSNGVTFDVRFQFSQSSVTLATRCTLSDGQSSEIVGVTAKARVGEDGYTVLESKEQRKDDGKVLCQVTLRPREVTRCPDDSFATKQGCFELSGTTFVQYETPIEKLALTKLSD